MILQLVALLIIPLNFVEVSVGFGRHESYLSPQHQIESIKYNVIATVLAVIGQALIKTSICLLLLRLLGNAAARKRKLFLYMLMLVLWVYNTVDIITILIQCKPTSKIWNRELEGSCWSSNVQDGFAYAQGGLLTPV